MDLFLQHSTCNLKSTITISGSKSETNRLLLLQALYPNLKLENSSNSDDSVVMTLALQTEKKIIDIHHAGTAMRFLTAFFSTQPNREIILTGSDRMKERPIKILVEALQQLGAKIEYLENEGYPPIKIVGQKIFKNQVALKADVSSQYISALLLIAPKLENGLQLTLEGKITSIPYIKMTLSLLNEIGVKTVFEENSIKVVPQKEIVISKPQIIESDWSSASYFYSIVALSKIGTQITLNSYKKNSLQGDAILSEIYNDFGVQTQFESNSIVITKNNNSSLKTLNYNLNNSPDIAQTIAVTCFGLGITCNLTGLHTLKIKETDRLEAMKVELSKLGATISTTNDSLSLLNSDKIIPNISIETYNDHRMAMAFAPLALKTNLYIQNASVVSKSYQNFWKDLESLGVLIEK